MKHSKITSIFLALLILLTLTAIPATASAVTEPLLLDGSFEEWGTTGLQEAWKLYKNDSAGTGNVSISDAYAHDGKYSAYVTDKIDAAENPNAGVRTVLYQELSGLPQNVALTFSAWVKVDAYSTLAENAGGIRLIGRGPDVNGSTVVGASSNITAVTDGWQQLSFSGTVTTSDPICLEIDIMANTANYEIYIDQFEIERPKPVIKEGDFEQGGINWAFQNGAENSPNKVKTENGNTYVYLDTHQHRVVQTVNNLVPGTKYRLSYDMCSNAAVGWLDRGSGASCMLWDGNTNGQWERRYVEWTQGSGETSMTLRLLFNNGSAPEGSYVIYDNFVLEESDAAELAKNGSFEYGAQGGGLNSWTTEGNATFTQVDGGIDGAKAMNINNPGNGDETINGFDDAKLIQTVVVPASSKIEYYELSVYVKNSSLTGNGTIIFRPDDFAKTYDCMVEFSTGNLPKNEWVRLRSVKPVAAEGTSFTYRLFIRDVGEILVDNFSCRKLDAPVVTFAKANGAYTEKMEDGVKADIAMPVSETGMVVLAVYSRTNNANTLADVKMDAITETDITRGYKKFTLSAASLEDFETVNYYAKLLILKNGTLVPYIDDILLTK